MSRRIKRTQPRSDRRDDRPARGRDKHPERPRERVPSERPKGHRAGGKPARFDERRPEQRQNEGPEQRHGKRASIAAEPAKSSPEAQPLPTKVQTVVVTADEDNMRVDRFLEARFPGLSFSHIQRIVRKGELRVDGKRADRRTGLWPGSRFAFRRCASTHPRWQASCPKPRPRRSLR